MKTSSAATTVEVLLVFLLLAAGPAVTTAAPASTLDQARAKLAAGEVGEAARLAEAAVRSARRNPQAHVVFASVLLYQGKVAEAERSFEFALALDPSVRGEVGEAFVAAVRHVAATSGVEEAEELLSQALGFDPELREPAVEALFVDALRRYRAGEATGEGLLAHWTSRFPDFTPTTEEDLFSFAAYHEAQGRPSEAAALYARCAAGFPEGELGRRATEVLQPRRVALDRRLSVSCSARLFVELRGLVLGFDSTIAELAFAWVSEDRAGVPAKALHLLPDTRMETNGGAAAPAVFAAGGTRRQTPRIDLQTDRVHQVELTFPPVARDEERIDLFIANDSCGTSGRRGRYSLDFRAIPLSTTPTAGGAERDRDRELAIPVFHLHDYFVTTGHCEGTLHLSPQGIAYRSDWHTVELPCELIEEVVEGRDAIADPLQRFGQAGIVPTLLIKGPGLTRRGREKMMTWQFLAVDGTPPALLLAKDPCRSAR